MALWRWEKGSATGPLALGRRRERSLAPRAVGAPPLGKNREANLPFGARERGRNPTCNPSNFLKTNTCNPLISEGLQVGLRPPLGGAKGPWVGGWVVAPQFPRANGVEGLSAEGLRVPVSLGTWARAAGAAPHVVSDPLCPWLAICCLTKLQGSDQVAVKYDRTKQREPISTYGRKIGRPLLFWNAGSLQTFRPWE